MWPARVAPGGPRRRRARRALPSHPTADLVRFWQKASGVGGMTAAQGKALAWYGGYAKAARKAAPPSRRVREAVCGGP